jgi:hypothetical protein
MNKKPQPAWRVGQGERAYIISADTAHNAIQKAMKHDKLLVAIGCEAEPLTDTDGNRLYAGLSILD